MQIPEINHSTPPSPISLPSATSPSQRADDTLSAHTGRPALPYVASRPKLAPPCEWKLLEVTDDTREIGNAFLGNLTKRISQIKGKIQAITEENIQKLEESAQRASKSGFWSMLKKISTALLAALSFITGIALTSTGGAAFVGGAMIASGVFSLTNFALTETGGWDWVSQKLSKGNDEWRKKLSVILPTVIGIVSGGVGLVGSVWGVATNAIQLADKAMLFIQSALAIFDAGTTFGKGHADARLLWTQADMTEISGRLEREKIHGDTLFRNIESNMEEFRAIKSDAKKAITAARCKITHSFRG